MTSTTDQTKDSAYAATAIGQDRQQDQQADPPSHREPPLDGLGRRQWASVEGIRHLDPERTLSRCAPSAAAPEEQEVGRVDREAEDRYADERRARQRLGHRRTRVGGVVHTQDGRRDRNERAEQDAVEEIRGDTGGRIGEDEPGRQQRGRLGRRHGQSLLLSGHGEPLPSCRMRPRRRSARSPFRVRPRRGGPSHLDTTRPR